MRLSTSAEQQNWSSAELQQQREKLLGADAAERLAQLDQERARWNEQLQSYLQQRSTLQHNANLAPGDRASALTDLRSQFFSDTDLPRIIALEHLHDSQP